MHEDPIFYRYKYPGSMHSVQNCNLKCKYIGMSENVMLTSHFADSDSDSAFLSCLWRILYKVQTAQAQYVAE